MKIKCLALVLILVIFTGCSKVEEFTGGVKEVKDTYDEVKQQVDDNLKNIKSKDLEKVKNLEKVKVIEGVADIANFGEFEPTEFISRGEESISDGFVTEYYSSASFEKVVSHYKTMLEGSEDYDITEYPSSYTQMCGMVGDVFVQLGIEKNDDDKTYIVYQYENPTQATANNESKSSVETTSSDFSPEFDEFYNNQIEILKGNPDIIIREEIGKLDFEEIKEDWNTLGYPETVYMDLVIVSEDPETGPFNATADVFIKGDNINMTIYTEFGEITGIYNASKNETYYKNSMAVGSDTEVGCTLPFRLLDLNDFQYIEDSIGEGEYMPQYCESPKDGSKDALIWFFHGDTWGHFGYDFDKRVIHAYTEEGMETVYNDTYPKGKDFPYSHHWHATEIKTGIDIKDDLFTW
ncbi:hypothetical protein SH2C18_20610 [Clostridium sediminicola]|uniref:hypothetical protein n=1 Tax=Clostridium sediminicola TaxID=3114879 RepID=UPI0031F27B3A